MHGPLRGILDPTWSIWVAKIGGAEAGRLPKVADSTIESATIRTILYEETHKAFKELAEDQGIELARSTLENLAHDHRDDAHPQAIVRAAQLQEPLLTPDNMEWRYEYSLWALARLKVGAIFFFSDEDCHNFGGVPHKRQHNPDGKRAKRAICSLEHAERSVADCAKILVCKTKRMRI